MTEKMKDEITPEYFGIPVSEVMKAKYYGDFLVVAAVAAEREACAKSCEDDESGRDSGGYFASIIRERSNDSAKRAAVGGSALGAELGAGK